LSYGKRKKKEKIQNLKKKKEQKEIDSVNNDKNIHYKKKIPNDQLPSVLERLYTKDLEKRRQNKQILTKIYTPSFTPFLYSKGEPKKFQKRPEQIRNQSATNRNRYNNYKNYNNTIDENHNDEDNDYDDENDSENEYEGKKKKKKGKLIKIKKAKSKGKTKALKVRFKVDNHSSDNEDDKVEKEEEVEEVHHDRAEVENALRNRLFRNKSATKRKMKL
jgi:hypothetical protein